MGLLNTPDYTIYSAIGGFLGAFGSFLGKLSGSYDSLLCWLIFFIAMISVNSIGSVYFAKSLNKSVTSLQPTLIATATNFVVTAIFGVLFYEETTGLLWWIGTTLIIAGIVLVSQENKKEKIQ